jgi:hypothetical protein
MMAKQLLWRGWACSMVTGIGLMSAGCTDTPDNQRLDDTPMACTAETRVYQLTTVDPSRSDVHQIDLDGDGVPDNALGAAHDEISGVDPKFAVAPRFASRLASDVPWLVAIDRCGDDVRVTIDEGMQVPGGSVPTMPELLPRAVGTLNNGVLEARDGQAHVPLAAMADASRALAAPRWILGDGVVIRATLLEGADTETLDGVFGVALPADAARGELEPPLAAFLTAQPADDLLKLGADGNGDGVITEAELGGTQPFQNATAGDVTPVAPDGTPRFDTPAVSIALRFHAVRIR